jgi:hypothetical protein
MTVFNSASETVNLESSKNGKETSTTESKKEKSMDIALTKGIATIERTVEESTDALTPSTKSGKGEGTSLFALPETNGKSAPAKARRGLMRKSRGARKYSIKNVIPQ